MKQAAYLLVHDKVNISEVAYRVGFSTPSYFSSSFREYFGMTPKEFVARYGERIMDRIAHFGTIANCTGENLREKG